MNQMRNQITVVEIEVNSRCNRKCGYCPVSVLPIPEVPHFMSLDTLDRILTELVKIEFNGRFSYHFYNEPLLRRDLEQIVERVKLRLPDCFQVLYTNGDLLTDRRYESLAAAGIRHFKVTSHGMDPHPARPFQEVQFPADLELTNRGGVMTGLPEVTPDILKLPCFAPSEMLIFTVTGDVVLCYEDAERRYFMGNIHRSSLEEIWFSEEFVRIRRLVADGQRLGASTICGLCTNQAHQEPGLSLIP